MGAAFAFIGDRGLLSNSATSAGTETAIAVLENQWLQSQQTNNPDLVAPLLAEKFVYTGGDGKLTNKATMLADSKATKWNSVEYKELQITVFGTTAIATAEFVGKGADASGKAIDDRSRFTDTWTKMPSGKWQCVASQDTPIKM